jgi:hypothetical protein
MFGTGLNQFGAGSSQFDLFQDINECQANNGGCDVNARCINTFGSQPYKTFYLIY